MSRKPILGFRKSLSIPRFMCPTIDDPYGYIYLTINKINGKMYIGKHQSTSFDKKYLGSGKHLCRAIRKYGKSYFVCEVIDWASSLEELNNKEKWWISFMGAVQSNEFYNMSDGGDGHTSEEAKRFTTSHTIELLRMNFTGAKNPMYSQGYKVSKEKNGKWGTHLTEQERRKLSECAKHRTGSKNPFYGRKHSDSTKELIRKANTGRYHTEEWKQKASKQRTGRIWVNDNWSETRFIQPLELNSLLAIGWSLGRLNDLNLNKFLYKEAKSVENLKLKIKYHDSDLEHIRKLDKGDWIDLRAAEDVDLKSGEFKLISLGVSMQLPPGYEAHLATRSSTFKTWGVLMANSHGIIDESYNGDGDIWRFPALAMRDTHISKNDRICQFRLVKKMEPVFIEEVSELGNPDRGGIGSTGKQ